MPFVVLAFALKVNDCPGKTGIGVALTELMVVLPHCGGAVTVTVTPSLSTLPPPQVERARTQYVVVTEGDTVNVAAVSRTRTTEVFSGLPTYHWYAKGDVPPETDVVSVVDCPAVIDRRAAIAETAAGVLHGGTVADNASENVVEGPPATAALTLNGPACVPPVSAGAVARPEALVITVAAATPPANVLPNASVISTCSAVANAAPSPAV